MHQGRITRRTLLGGLGAGGVVLGATGALTASAGAVGAVGAAGPQAGRPGSASGATGVGRVSASTTIESEPQAGVTYLYRSTSDFTPWFAPVVAAGEYGTFTVPENRSEDPDPWGVLMSELDVPVGAELVDVEWYVHNDSGEVAWGCLYDWVPGVVIGGEDSELLLTPIPSGPGLSASRSTFDEPVLWPANGRLVAAITAPAAGDVQLNGVRVGFRGGARRTVTLASPQRVYDSRTQEGALAPNGTRSISLSAALPPWAAGAVFELSITATNGTGTLRIGRAGVTPAATAIQWSRTGDKVTNLVISETSVEQAIAVWSAASNGSTHLIVDVVGYLV